MKSMPHEQLTINNFIFALVKLPFCEEYGGIAQLGARLKRLRTPIKIE